MMKSVLIYPLVVVVNLITSIGFCLSDEPDKEKSLSVLSASVVNYSLQHIFQ